MANVFLFDPPTNTQIHELLESIYTYEDTPDRVTNYVTLCDCQYGKLKRLGVEENHHCFYHTTHAEKGHCVMCGNHVLEINTKLDKQTKFVELSDEQINFVLDSQQKKEQSATMEQLLDFVENQCETAEEKEMVKFHRFIEDRRIHEELERDLAELKEMVLNPEEESC